MVNPFVPIISLISAAAMGRPNKRRRKKNQSKTNGTSTQRNRSRALDIIRIQRGLPRNASSSQTADEAAETNEASQQEENHRPTTPGVHRRQPNGEAKPADAPMLRLSKLISTDTIGLTSDGKRGYVGAQWWARSGRDALNQIRRRHPSATPDEALALLLKQTVPSVDWDNEELPRGAQMLLRRLRRLVEASYMGREETPAPTDASEARQRRTSIPRAAAGEPPRGVPTEAASTDIDAKQTTAVPPGFDPEGFGESLGDAATDEPEAAGDAHRATRRGSRGGRGGKKDRKAALAAQESHVAAEDGNGPEDGGGDPDGAVEDTAAPNTDPPPGQ